jgi:ribonuclease J
VAPAAAGRRTVVIGRAMRRVIDVATELGYLDGLPAFLSEDEFGYFPRNKILLLCTGSQGEDRAALSRISRNDHPRVALSPGDLVIFSSRTIPGNEKAVNELINGLAAQSVDVLTDRDDLVHVSGHPRRDELVEMFGWLKPELVVPVHGEPMHLKAQAELAAAAGLETVVGGNGKMIRLAPGPAVVIDEIEPGLLFRDGELLLAPEASGVAERRRLAFAGAAFATVVLDGTFRLDEDPHVALFGIPAHDAAGEPFQTIIEDAIIQAVESIPRARRRDLKLVEQASRRAVRSTLAQRWGKKPSCRVVVIQSV